MIHDHRAIKRMIMINLNNNVFNLINIGMTRKTNVWCNHGRLRRTARHSDRYSDMDHTSMSSEGSSRKGGLDSRKDSRELMREPSISTTASTRRTIAS